MVKYISIAAINMNMTMKIDHTITAVLY